LFLPEVPFLSETDFSDDLCKCLKPHSGCEWALHPHWGYKFSEFALARDANCAGCWWLPFVMQCNNDEQRLRLIYCVDPVSDRAGEFYFADAKYASSSRRVILYPDFIALSRYGNR
jgi:hypothetical protein